jgi:hypothetical protein
MTPKLPLATTQGIMQAAQKVADFSCGNLFERDFGADYDQQIRPMQALYQLMKSSEIGSGHGSSAGKTHEEHHTPVSSPRHFGTNTAPNVQGKLPNPGMMGQTQQGVARPGATPGIPGVGGVINPLMAQVNPMMNQLHGQAAGPLAGGAATIPFGSSTGWSSLGHGLGQPGTRPTARIRMLSCRAGPVLSGRTFLGFRCLPATACAPHRFSPIPGPEGPRSNSTPCGKRLPVR